MAVNCCVAAEATVALVGVTVTLTVAGGVTEIVEDADALGVAMLVAVTVAVVVLDTVGAVNKPLAEIDPAFVLHRTCVLLVPWTAAVNCCVAAEATVALVGVTVTLTAARGVTDIVEEAATSGFATLVALIVVVVALETVGAVNKPLAEIDPALALHRTSVLVVP